MGYSSCLHKPCILSLACLGFSPIDCDQCEIIEETYQQSIGAQERDSLQCLDAAASENVENPHKYLSRRIRRESMWRWHETNEFRRKPHYLCCVAMWVSVVPMSLRDGDDSLPD